MNAYFELSALPPLGDLGTVLPLTASAMRDLLEGDDQDAVDAVLLGDDLAQHVAFMAGEAIEPSPVVLSAAQVCGRLRLPEPLSHGADGLDGGDLADRLYARYFAHVVDEGDRTGVPLLGEWASYEVTLRQALADVRARRLGRTLGHEGLAAELGARANLDGGVNAGWADVAPVVHDWLQAEDPLDGERRLERARWMWISERDDWFGFSRTELVAYALRLALLERWRAREDPEPGASRDPRAAPTEDTP